MPTHPLLFLLQTYLLATLHNADLIVSQRRVVEAGAWPQPMARQLFFSRG